jgi:hypothetical protein
MRPKLASALSAAARNSNQCRKKSFEQVVAGDQGALLAPLDPQPNYALISAKLDDCHLRSLLPSSARLFNR